MSETPKARLTCWTLLHDFARFCLWLFLLWLVVGIFTIKSEVRTAQYWFCPHCRSTRIEESYLDWHWQKSQTNEFTAWYEQNRPPHEHRWERSSPVFRSNLLGLPTRVSCGIRHPLAGLPPATELEFVQTASAKEVEVFFAGVLSTNRAEQFAAVSKARQHVEQRHTHARR